MFSIPALRILLLATLFLPATLRAVEPIPAFTPGARILFQGDSITDGKRGRSADPNHILGHGYVFIIAAKFGAAFPEAKLEFFNRGVSGNTVLDLEKRWQADTLDLKPDVLSILIGVNDKVVNHLATTPQNGSPNTDIVKRQEIVAKLAARHGAALVHFQKALDEATRRAPATHWIWDNVHPTYSGHQILADEWERTVRAFWPAAGEKRSR